MFWGLWAYTTWRGRGLSEYGISRVISTLNGVTPIITLLITILTKSPAPPSTVIKPCT